ncbi:MAG: ABC transporter permease [Spirochaetes bacterium]|nr:ABC transporter permease [Spirochaetota bacterium]
MTTKAFWKAWIKRLNIELKIGLVLSFFITALSLASFFWTPFDYNLIDHQARFLSPNARNILGTDNFGRDVFSRIMVGGRHTLLLAFATVAAAAAAGTLLGLFAGFAGGLKGEVIMRIMDAINSFPGILLALVMVALLDNSMFTLFTALVILFIPSYTRVMRSGTLQYKKSGFVLAQRVLGASPGRIIFIHILPNLKGQLLSASVIGLSNAILAESAMSYLGLGVQPPAPSWGRMLSESQNFFFSAPWSAAFPGVFIMLTVIAFHCMGEGLRRQGEPHAD